MKIQGEIKKNKCNKLKMGCGLAFWGVLLPLLPLLLPLLP